MISLSPTIINHAGMATGRNPCGFFFYREKSGDAVIFGILGVLVGVVGIAISLILARRGRQKPDIRYAIDTEAIVVPEDRLLQRGLSMNFSGKPIARLSKTTLALWNQHGNTVRGQDIVDDDPLRIVFGDEDSVLQTRIIGRSRIQNKVDAKSDTNSISQVIIHFDFLDEGDGTVVEFLHEGTIPAPRIAGTIRGATLRSAGDASLNPNALEAVGIKSRIKRFGHYVPFRIKLLVLSLPVAYLLFSLIAIGYRIDTQGLDAFTIIASLLLLTLSFMSTMPIMYLLTRSVIPSSIVAIRDR